MNVGLKDLVGWTCFEHVERSKWNTTQASGVLLQDFAHHQSHNEFLRLFGVFSFSYPPLQKELPGDKYVSLYYLK